MAAGRRSFNPHETDGKPMLEFGNGVVKNVTGDHVEGACWNTSAGFPNSDFKRWESKDGDRIELGVMSIIICSKT